MLFMTVDHRPCPPHGVQPGEPSAMHGRLDDDDDDCPDFLPVAVVA
jgi:hypothetical protein